MSDDNQRDGVEQSRRSFMGATAASLGLGGGRSGALSSPTASQSDGSYAPKQHDHSGHFGTATELGKHAPVESITVDDLKSTDTPFVDVTAYGVVGDGETDDAAAFQAAADAATPHGVLYVPHDVTLHFEETIDMGLENPPLPDNEEQNQFAFICHGTLNPAPGLGDAIHIYNGRFPYVYAQVDGGGKDVDTDNAIHITEMEGGLYEGTASHYDGTFFKVDNGSYITTLVSIGHVRTRFCGQSIHMNIGEGSTHPGLFGLGEIQDVWDHSPVRCPKFRGVYDICINQYENLVADRTEQGMVFESCASVWADTIAVGGQADVDLLVLDNVADSHFNSVLAAHSNQTGIVLDNARRIVLQAQAIANNVGLRIDESLGVDPTEKNNIYVNARGNGAQGVLIGEDVTGDFNRLSGNVFGNGAPMEVRTEIPDHIILDQMYIDENDGVAQLVVPSMLEDTVNDDLVGTGIAAKPVNGVRIFNSHVPSIEGEPRVIDSLGREVAPAEQPDPAFWERGDLVEFVDTGDDTGSGVYLRLPEETWSRIGDIGR